MAGSCASRRGDGGAASRGRRPSGSSEAADGSFFVAATPGSHWGENLLVDPVCRVTVGDRTFEAVATPLDGADHAHAIRELILRYGTPSEGLGRGPSFRLVPAEEVRG